MEKDTRKAAIDEETTVPLERDWKKDLVSAGMLKRISKSSDEFLEVLAEVRRLPFWKLTDGRMTTREAYLKALLAAHDAKTREETMWLVFNFLPSDCAKAKEIIKREIEGKNNWGE